MHKVLKSFPYSHDGLKTEVLTEGTQREFQPDLVDGLVAAGLIGPAEGKGTSKTAKSSVEG